jgi:hypothetical protein
MAIVVPFSTVPVSAGGTGATRNEGLFVTHRAASNRVTFVGLEALGGAGGYRPGTALSRFRLERPGLYLVARRRNPSHWTIERIRVVHPRIVQATAVLPQSLEKPRQVGLDQISTMAVDFCPTVSAFFRRPPVVHKNNRGRAIDVPQVTCPDFAASDRRLIGLGR